MTQTLQSQSDLYAAAFDAIHRESAEPVWFTEHRRRAFDRFLAGGFPTSKDEAWRFIDLRAITQTAFAAARDAAVSAADVAGLSLARSPLLVFVNGYFHRDLSRLDGLPAGVRVLGFQEALTSDGEPLQSHLGKIVGVEGDPFTALNLALTAGGAVVYISRGTHVPGAIHVLSIAVPNGEPFVTHPHNLILAEPGSSAVVVERYAALGAGDYWTNALTEAVVGENADLTHYFLEEEAAQASNISTLAVRQERGSSFTSHTALLGGRLVRNNVYVALRGEGCRSLVNGLFVAGDSQTMDNHMRVVHGAPHGESRQFYKGVIGGQARGVFTGRILVEPGAQKTDAKQTNRNLLLSDEARIDTQPQLEIYADDVKCTHGATTGRLDADAMFYLRSRGLEERAARALLIYAFAHESLDRMGEPAVRAYLARLLLEKLPEGQAVASTLGGLTLDQDFAQGEFQ